MKILYHHRTLADGAEGIHIARMVEAFQALGHEVEVRGLGTGNDGSPQRGLVQAVKQLPSAAFEVASLASNAADYVDVRRALRSTRPDFLYKRHARHDVGALYAARRAGIPSVLEVNCLFTADQYHQFEPIALRPLAARLERRALALADVVLAVSTPLAREIHRISSAHPIVLPNGADPERFDPARTNATRVRSRYRLGRALVVGWVGVMRAWHGLELLVEAVAKIPQLRLLIVGDGPARPAIERHAATNGLAHRMAITGRVAQDEMPDYLAAMDIAVVAADGTGIASPMKLLEYMAMERAVVAPRLENIRDLLTEEHDGVLFTADSSTDLERTLRRLTVDDALRAALGREARQTIQNRRNWRCNAAQVVALVSERASTIM